MNSNLRESTRFAVKIFSSRAARKRASEASHSRSKVMRTNKREIPRQTCEAILTPFTVCEQIFPEGFASASADFEVVRVSGWPVLRFRDGIRDREKKTNFLAGGFC